MKGKKILLLSSEFPPGPGGIGQHAFSLASYLKDKYPLKVMSVSDYALEEECVKFDQLHHKIDLIRFKRKHPLIIQFYRVFEILICFSKYKPEVIILTGRFPLSVNAIINWFFRVFGTRVICVLHGSEIAPANIFQLLINQFGIKNSDVIISVSKFTESLIPKRIKEQVHNLRIIGNGITKEMELQWTLNKENKLVQKNYLNLLTVGNVIPRKGQHNVVEAIPFILSEFGNVEYNIVGIRRFPEIVDVKIEKLNVSKQVKFHGRILNHQDLIEHYQNADVFMLLSENLPNGDVEGFGIVALEANYFGLPVIGSRGTGVEAAISNGNSGILVDPKNPKEIVEAIKQILDNKEHFKNESRKWANENHWEILINKYVEIIDNL